jgi:hypothetical protein
MLSPFFSFSLSPPSGIATCTALHAIRRFLQQYCSWSSDPDKFTFFLHFKNFSSVFREILKGKDCLIQHANTNTYLKGLLSPFVSVLWGIKFLFAICKRGIEQRVQNWEQSAK